jgi:chromosome segregation and condensation protein ScpB
MAQILFEDEKDIDIDEIERSVVNGISSIKQEPKLDIVKDYDKELNKLAGRFNIDVNPKKTAISDILDDEEDDEADEKINFNSVDDSFTSNDNNKFNFNQYDDTYKPMDKQLEQMTTEQRKQKQINNVLGNLDQMDDDAQVVEEDDEEDEMAKIMEQIDLLRTNLEAEGIDLSRIQVIGASHTKKEAKRVLRMLQIKNDRLRYCDMFEEGILAGCYGLESLFDGKKVWFGSQVDLTGWTDTVKVKLRRMRYDTSTFVGEIVKGYNIGSGWRILFELLPSIFLYSRDRRLRANDNLISDSKYRDAIRDLNN